MPYLGSVPALLYQSIKDSKPFLFVDGKGDHGIQCEIVAMSRRSELAQGEMLRRKVRFLPVQVLRPIWAAAGLRPGFYRRLPRQDVFHLALHDLPAASPVKS